MGKHQQKFFDCLHEKDVAAVLFLMVAIVEPHATGLPRGMYLYKVESDVSNNRIERLLLKGRASKRSTAKSEFGRIQ